MRIATDAGSVAALEKVSVSLGGRPVLREISLSVPQGQVIAVLGANGSGKSTMIRAMLGLTTRTGSAQLFGTEIDDFRGWHRVGYVPQFSTIANGVASSAREIVDSGRLSRRRPLLPKSARDRQAVASALASVGLEDRAKQPVSTMSGGQRQRVLIARALAGQPDFFILDEPTAGVDLISQKSIATTLKSLVSHGATAVVVLHELGPFAPLIDRALVLSDGRVVFDDHPDRLHQSAAPQSLPSHHHHGSDLSRPAPSPGVVQGLRP